MRFRVTLIGISLTLILPASALAHRQTVNESFTLTQAMNATMRYEQGDAQVLDCYRINQRQVACDVFTPPEVIATNTAPVQLRWTDLIERNGPTPAGHIIRPGVASGVIGDPTKWNGSNTGPLTVTPIPSTLEIN